MATILSSYSLAGGDTTSSVFTYSGSARNLDIEILTTSISGGSTRVLIETSADNSLFVLVPGSEMQLSKGSDSYVYHITESEGAYVRAKVYANDSRTGTITINATEPTAGNGDLLAANNLSELTATAATSRTNLGFADGIWTPTFTAQSNPSNTAVAAYAWSYIRTGNTVMFSGKVDVQFDTLETADDFHFNIPIARAANFVSRFQLTGNVTPYDASTSLSQGSVEADQTTTDTCDMVIAVPVAGNAVTVEVVGFYRLTNT